MPLLKLTNKNMLTGPEGDPEAEAPFAGPEGQKAQDYQHSQEKEA